MYSVNVVFIPSYVGLAGNSIGGYSCISLVRPALILPAFIARLFLIRTTNHSDALAGAHKLANKLEFLEHAIEARVNVVN